MHVDSAGMQPPDAVRAVLPNRSAVMSMLFFMSRLMGGLGFISPPCVILLKKNRICKEKNAGRLALLQEGGDTYVAAGVSVGNVPLDELKDELVRPEIRDVANIDNSRND